MTNIKTLFAAAALAATLSGCPSGQSNTPTTAEKFVAVTQIVEHPSLDAARQGLKDELAEAGLKEGETLQWKWQSAQGNPTTATQIAAQLVGENPDVIVAISTPSAQAIASVRSTIPLVFSAVTDPKSANLVPNLQKPGGNITGVSDLAPIAQQLDLIQEITPQAKRIGVLYNAGEANSTAAIASLEQEAAERNLTLVQATVSNSSGVLTAARSLVGKVDAIYIPTDNTIASALEAVLQVGTEQKIPVYASDPDSVTRGAIAALGFDYYDVGRQTGEIVLQILEGHNPGEIPVLTPQNLQLYLNPKAAAAMGVTIPEAVKAKAAKIL
jgi:putative ABC transport system substrate-binding protein